MNNEQQRIAVYNTITNYLVNIQQQNNIPSSVMEDAINKYLVQLKDQILQEYIISTQTEEQKSVEYEQEEENGN